MLDENLCTKFAKLIFDVMDWYTVETERYRSELATVRAELEPWEKELIVHKGKLEVTCTESKLLCEKVCFLYYFWLDNYCQNGFDILGNS